ncbi:coronin-6 [Tothia fuscella]|uniref:Coronin n=1 Tax=Tothia fuscella TaxID=1048955 RepID=A0A9P4NGP1_9PEZI|nr:coronin-6 [Tothia fuscella]
MAGRFVRASKYRHVFGQSTKKEQCYDNLRISKNAWDTNLIKANPEYISVNWEASGGGAFAVIPVGERGRLPDRLPLFRGHTAAVLDTDWNPFDDNLLASGSDDGKVFLWRVPENFSLYSDAEDPPDVSPVGRLSGHTRKVGHVLFNPAASNVLASSSGDYTIKLWDIEQGQSRLQLKHGDIVQSLSWSPDGALLVTTCRDKKLRIWDVRQEKPVQEHPGHTGAKNSRAVWMGEHDMIATTGFSRMSDRQLGLWDVKMPKEPVGGFQILDSISGVCMPFWDDGTNCLYLAGKGDGNIRYFEYENGKFEYLSEYKSADPQRGIAFLPKRGINLHENEIMRAYKTVNDSLVEPVSFIVPRRAEVFQEDIYPPTIGLKPGVSGKEWFDGKTAAPPKISLESVYEGKGATEMPSDYKPAKMEAPTSTPATKTEAPKPKAAPEPVSSPRTADAPSKLEDNKASMSAAASRFAEKDADEESSSGEESGFEEIPKPIERPTSITAIKQEQKTAGAEIKTEALQATKVIEHIKSPTKTVTPKPTPAPAAASLNRPSEPKPGGAADSLKSHLADLKEQNSRILSLLEQQNRTLGRQTDQIMFLSEEVEKLKGKGAAGGGGVNGNRELEEKVRRLELELEEARSA